MLRTYTIRSQFSPIACLSSLVLGGGGGGEGEEEVVLYVSLCEYTVRLFVY